jgi:rod shape-determining protein MreC
MNKKLSFVFILLALFVGAVYYSDVVQSPIQSSLNTIKSSYLDTLSSIDSLFEKHFFQARRIENLNKKLQNCEKNKVLMLQLSSELQDLYKNNNADFSNNPKLELVKSISYETFGNLNRVWIDMKEFNTSKIYGLTYKEFVAGIVVPHNNKPLALLNKDIKSTYAVYIGAQKAPGIAHGNNDQNIVINFIPAWFNIHKGDEVITSGLDTVFFKGLKVGKVLSVSKSQGYQNAIVKPYYQANEPHYFYLIRSTQ